MKPAKRKSGGDAMRMIHRISAILSVAIMLYIGVIGTWMQLLDMRALYALDHAPLSTATSPASPCAACACARMAQSVVITAEE